MKKITLTSLAFCLILAFSSIATSCSSDDSTSQKDDDPIKGDTYYVHKVSLEDYTSIGCVACPIGSFTIEEIAKTEFAERVIPIGIHADFQGIKDPWTLPLSNQFAVHMKVQYLPSLYWNRNNVRWNSGDFLYGDYDENENVYYFLEQDLFKEYIEENNYIKEKSNIGIKIASDLTLEEGEITVSFKFSEDISQPLKYVIYILEDNLVYRQANGSPLYGNTTGEPRWEPNFVHHNVVLGANNILGDEIDASLTIKDEEYSETSTITYNGKDINNLKVAVLVLDKDGKTLNAQIAKANTTQDYEIYEPTN